MLPRGEAEAVNGRGVGRLTAGLTIAIAATGLWLRAAQLDEGYLWVDEAETAINALTILDHGLPVDHYLGLPIYENTLTHPWPEHPEYEFRDGSYSHKGVAVYHGWLPMYAIAASLWWHGIGPDQPTNRLLTVRHDAASERARTVAPRVPAVLFSAVFLLFAWLWGRELAGDAGGLAALALAALADDSIDAGSMSRYYAATLAFTAAAGWLTLRVIRGGQRRDAVALAVVWVLLFHTHIMSAFVAVLMFGLTLPWQSGPWRRRLVHGAIAGAILTAGTLPWLVFTGFLEHKDTLPKAWRLMNLPADLWLYPSQNLDALIVAMLAAALAVTLVILRHKLPPRLVRAFVPRRGYFLFVFIWAVLIFLTFNFMMPAASYFLPRLSLMLAVPMLGVFALTVGGIARSVAGRPAPLLAAMLVGVFLILAARSPRSDGHILRSKLTRPDVIAYLRTRAFPADARIYSTPNDHLIWTYYTGLPVQSIAPVRRSFLERYAGPIVMIEPIDAAAPMAAEDVRRWAAAFDQSLTDERAEELAETVYRRWLYRFVAGRADSVQPAPPSVPRFLWPLLSEWNHAQLAWQAHMHQLWGRSPFARGFGIRGLHDWWPVFFYRFVDPPSRMGPGLNYARRVASGSATVLSHAWTIVFESPRPIAGESHLVSHDDPNVSSGQVGHVELEDQP